MRRGAIILVAAVMACESDKLIAPERALVPSRRANAVPAPHNPRFGFLPPLGNGAQVFGGTPDFSLDPSIAITCSSGPCSGTTIATISGPALERQGDHYAVNWKPAAFGVPVGAVLRIAVLIRTTTLGTADYTVTDNRTLPIQFRIDRGAAGLISASGGGTATLDGGSVVVQFQPGAVSTDIAVTATPEPSSSPGALGTIPGTLYEFQPSPTTFTAPVTLSLTYPTNAPARLHPDRFTICKMIDDACHPILPSTVNAQARTVSAVIPSFSSYAVTVFPEVSYSVPGAGTFLHTPTGEVMLTSEFGDQYDWSADGSKVTFRTGGGDQERIHVAMTGGGGDHVMGVPGSWPRFSPDGTHIAYVEYGTGTVHVVASDGSNDRALGFSAAMLDWSPDGTEIAFAGDNCLCAVHPDGTGLRVITPNLSIYDGSGASGFEWSPDGKNIAFAGSGPQGDGLYVVPSQGGAPVEVLDESADPWSDNGINELVGWSPVPGDNVLLFYRGFASRIETVNADGTNEQSVLPEVGCWGYFSAEYATWSPDGTRIVGAQSYGLVLVNRDGSGMQTLAGATSSIVHWRP